MRSQPVRSGGGLRAVAGTALLLLSCLAQAGPEAVGRLFLSPAERAAIDRGQPLDGGDGQAVITYRLDGIVTRTSGRHTAFVNGRAVPVEDRRGPVLANVRAGEPQAARLTLPDRRQGAQARVGQSWRVEEGRLDDLLPPPSR